MSESLRPKDVRPGSTVRVEFEVKVRRAGASMYSDQWGFLCSGAETWALPHYATVTEVKPPEKTLRESVLEVLNEIVPAQRPYQAVDRIIALFEAEKEKA